jgi:hypothetical protein
VMRSERGTASSVRLVVADLAAVGVQSYGLNSGHATAGRAGAQFACAFER